MTLAPPAPYFALNVGLRCRFRVCRIFFANAIANVAGTYCSFFQQANVENNFNLNSLLKTKRKQKSGLQYIQKITNRQHLHPFRKNG